MDDERNFQPLFKQNPARFENDSDKHKCVALALSFFVSKEAAKKRFTTLLGLMGPEVYLKLGTQIAKGFLNAPDGVTSEPDKKGHFSHHPSETENYYVRFTIIETLK